MTDEFVIYAAMQLENIASTIQIVSVLIFLVVFYV